MTNLTARELIDTILRSLAETRATFKKASAPAVDNRSPQQNPKKELSRADEPADVESR